MRTPRASERSSLDPRRSEPNAQDPRPAGLQRHPDSSRPSRLIPVDALRGLIMIFMALDHASYFVARVHTSEWWGIPLPRYQSALAFLTRFVTHPCAPGFFFLLGLSMVFLAESRRRLGWTEGRIRRYFLWRGLLLVGLQLFVENPAWLFGHSKEMTPGGPGPIMVYLGVLFALGLSMILCALFLRLRTSILMAAGLLAVLATQLLIHGAASVSELYHPLLRAAFIPGQTGYCISKYPVIPWLGVALLGMAFGRKMARDPQQAYRLAFLLGTGALGLFLIVRSVGGPIGDFHPPAGPGWIAFLNLTKYPPSVAFLLATLGIALLLLGLLSFLSRREERFKRLGKPLLVFGRTALFFYVVHLYVYGLIGLAFPDGSPFGLMYMVWLCGLVLFYFLCSGYARFKARQAPDSLWRML